jgi:Glycosyltransferase 61
MVSADEVRHRLLYRAILARNRVRRVAWGVLALVPARASRALRSTDLVEPDDSTTPPSASQPGARETYALHLTGELVIEPHNGWIIAGHTRLVEQSMPYHVWTSAVPNLLAKPSIAAAFIRPARDVGPVASLRIAWDDNYYHFYNDVLARLRLVDSVVPPDVPVVLSESMARRPYVKAWIEHGVFGARAVIAQPAGTYLRCAEVYVVDKRGGDRRDWDYFLDRLDERGPGAGSRRVLLVRAPERGRALINDREVRDVCQARGFEVVDTDGWTLAAQIDLFRDTSLVVGVHGAGLTNVVFRRGGTLRLLELIPPGPFPLSFNAAHDGESDYESLCRYFGFAYSALIGSIRGRIYKRTQNFSVDAHALAAALDDLER